jgi:hypothetical protein
MGFAAAIGYRRGGRDPNATAIMNRLRDDIITDPPVVDHAGTLALEAGLAFLGFQTRTLLGWFRAWRRQLAALARASELPDLTSTTFGPAHLVVLGADDLLAYFTSGTLSRLERGRARLRQVAVGQAGAEDLNARWVAAHLLAFSGEAQAGSLWNPAVIPPTVPSIVRQAFTFGTPSVLTLWEPQRDLLTGPRSPFDPAVLRMVMAVPTSGGKTLLAQLMAVEQLERTDRGVCYVAPTRSLCREVRRAMADRVRILQKEAGADLQDFPSLFAQPDFLDHGPPPDVEVMTPERLANMLRHDAAAVLERFGMFIFDEAQHIKERGRGFTLESTIALLDYLTRDTDHRIALISAAMGNVGAIADWLSPNGSALRHESAWRGPRRLHAVFTTKAHFQATTVEKIKITKGTVWPYRHVTDVTGLIRLRLANGHTEELPTEGGVGWLLVRKAKSAAKYPGKTEIDTSRSTKHYMIASEMIAMLGHAGSVLVVAGTRKQAQQIAGGPASIHEEHPALAALVDFVRLQLGDSHPLVACLRRGVGFHHAGLPTEVQEALEDASREDTLPYLTCTSTLTDGINLPVRTVVIYDQPYEGQHEDARLRGARLVNAMGRAGRAGRETEGWIVLTRAAEPTEDDFRDLNPDPDTLSVTSSLITDEALNAFTELEHDLRHSQDAVFDAADAQADFISFVWLLLAVEEDRGAEPADVDVRNIVDATLAAHQSPAARAACARIAQAVQTSYLAADPVARRRWPRTGTTIGSARTIDDLARRLARRIIVAEQQDNLPDIQDPAVAIRARGLLSTLLDLSEAPPWRFRVSSQGVDIPIAPAKLLADWLSGSSLTELAETHLASASKASSRIEQMVDAVTLHFEHFLSWTVGALVELVNLRLADADSDARLCPELGGYIRYGVNDPNALILMTSGIRSRRLAHAVVADLADDFDTSQENLRSWLAGMGIAEWRTRYASSASEILDLLDLLDFTRLRRRSLLKALLEQGSVKVELPDAPSVKRLRRGRLSLEHARGEESPAPLALYAGRARLATIGASDHADISSIIDTGLAIELDLDLDSVPPVLTVSLPLAEGE